MCANSAETELTRLIQLDPVSGSPRSEPDMEQGLVVPALETSERRHQGLPAPLEFNSAGTEEETSSREWDNRLGEGMAVVLKQGCGHPPDTKCKLLIISHVNVSSSCTQCASLAGYTPEMHEE